MKISTLFAAVSCLTIATAAAAQSSAPAAGPLILLLPTSTRATGLGNAWVAGRDDYSVFYNPAQINQTNGIGASFTRYGYNGTFGAFSGGATVGPVTFGWGVDLVEYKARNGTSYPFATTELTTDAGIRDALSVAATAGANFVYKGFRIGVGTTYAEDRVAAGVGAASAALHETFLLGNAGVSHPLWQGTAALAVENIGDRDKQRHVPTQTALGWNRSTGVGEFDLTWATQLSVRDKWLGAAGGAELGYGWIEGWSASFRAGAHRPEVPGQRPVTIGGGLNADRLTFDYALEFFEGNRYAHHITVRWR
jgi:hypothetical protein